MITQINNRTVEIEVNGKIHRFVKDHEDEPSEGATLVGVRYADSQDVHQLAPSLHAEPSAWDEANRYFGCS